MVLCPDDRSKNGAFGLKWVQKLLSATSTRTQFPNIELWVCGELDAGNPSMIRKDMLLDWIETKTIRYFGFVEDIRQVFSKSHCVVLPSYREGMPRVILEAMAMEKPVIVSDSAGCRQTVEDGISGIIARHGDSESLMTAMKQFAQMDTDAKKAMGRQARERAKTIFNSEKISIELFEIISQVYFCAK